MSFHGLRLLCLFFSVVTTTCATTAYAELCGIDSIFASGFQTDTSNPALSSTPGAVSSPGTAVSITTSSPITLTTTYPASGSTINGPTVDVAGTFVGPTNTGITVNGMVAYADGGQFLAVGVPMIAGSNTLTVSATTLNGQTGTTSVSVSQCSTSSDPIALNVSRRLAYAPYRMVFSPSIGTLPDGGTAQTVSIDYNGDGTDDVTNPSSSTTLTYLASTANLYTARLTVVSTNHTTYTTYTRYFVEDFKRQSGMLCDVYGYMKERLNAQDTSGALTAVGANAQDEFQPMFTNKASALPAYVANLGNIVDGYIDGRSGTFLVVRQKADLTLAGYHIEFSQNADGTWRIAGM